MSQISFHPPHGMDFSTSEDPFRYGWRYVVRKKQDGTQEVDQIPLTLEDVLHPQEGDVIPENTQQERDRRYLQDVYESLYADDPSVVTLSDCLVDWGIPGMRNHSPDLTVLADVVNPEGPWGIFHIPADGGHPILVAEIVSPSTRENDIITKRDHYHQIGIPVYLLIDQQSEDGSRTLLVLDHEPEGYRERVATPEGRYLLPGGVWVALEEGRVICYNAETGVELGDYTRVSQQLEEEVQARAEAERRARDAEIQAREALKAQQQAEEKARQAAEARSRAETQGRLNAEARAQAETKARQAAEARSRAETQARLDAEARTQAETKARQAAEARSRAETQARLDAEARAQAETKARLAAEAHTRALEEARAAVAAQHALEARIRELEERLRHGTQGQ